MSAAVDVAELTQTLPASVVTWATATRPPPFEFATSLAVIACVAELVEVPDRWHPEESASEARVDPGAALALCDAEQSYQV